MARVVDSRNEGPATSESTSGKSAPGRSTNWTNEEVKALLALWSEADIQQALDDPHTRNAKIYRRISKQLTQLGILRSHESVSNKIKALKHKYKAVVDSNRRSGCGRSTCPHFDDLDRILGMRPAVNSPPGMILESSGDTSENSGEGSQDSSLVLSETLESQESLSFSGDEDMPSDDDLQEPRSPSPPPTEPDVAGTQEQVHQDTLEEALDIESQIDSPLHSGVEDDEDVDAATIAVSSRPNKKQQKETRAQKSMSAMLKTFKEAQEIKDKWFISIQRQQLEAEQQAREQEMQLTRQLLEQQAEDVQRRKDKDKLQEDFMRAIIQAISSPNISNLGLPPQPHFSRNQASFNVHQNWQAPHHQHQHQPGASHARQPESHLPNQPGHSGTGPVYMNL